MYNGLRYEREALRYSPEWVGRAEIEPSPELSYFEDAEFGSWPRWLRVPNWLVNMFTGGI